MNKMYREKAFVLDRDIVAYAQRQAASCKYLERLFDEWIVETDDEALRVVLRCLTNVHLRQFEELGFPNEKASTSFYFHEMYYLCLQMDIPRIAIHAVSYLRGVLRYESLITGRSVLWPNLRRDALNNYELCFAYMVERLGPMKARSVIESAVKLEAEVMKKIDEKNLGNNLKAFKDE